MTGPLPLSNREVQVTIGIIDSLVSVCGADLQREMGDEDFEVLRKLFAKLNRHHYKQHPVLLGLMTWFDEMTTKTVGWEESE